VKRSRIEQALGSFAHSEPPGVMLALDVRFAAHLTRERFTAANLVQLRLPAHGGL
jgi:hypothetical protein